MFSLSPILSGGQITKFLIIQSKYIQFKVDSVNPELFFLFCLFLNLRKFT